MTSSGPSARFARSVPPEPVISRVLAGLGRGWAGQGRPLTRVRGDTDGRWRRLPRQRAGGGGAVDGPQVAPQDAVRAVFGERGQVDADLGALLRGAEPAVTVEV